VSDDAVARVEERLLGLIGLPPAVGGAARLGRCLRDAAAARGLPVDAYVDDLGSRQDAWQDLVDRVTVQESSFFRHPEQLALFADAVLPALRQPVRIWCAGCGNGQEAFSVAMLLEERAVDGTVLATDVSAAAVGRTRAGCYSQSEIGALSPERVKRHLAPADEGWCVRPAVRRRVATARHNLLDALPPQALKAHVVFCRNVLIYLSRPHVRQFLDRLSVGTGEGSVLFLGAAEVLPPTASFEAVQEGSTFYYRRTSGAPAVAR
jgi:chemotaxis methyl-accepting protein methylase